MTVHKMLQRSEIEGKQKINWDGKEKQPGGVNSWLVPSQPHLGEGVGASEQKGWISSFNPW